MEQGRIPDHLAMEASPDGQALAQSNNPGFLALHALAHCLDMPDRSDGNDYHSDSLLMLAQMAQQCEGQCKA